MTKVYLVTGATGFIGQHVVAELVRRGHKVIGIALADKNNKSLLWDDYKLRVAYTCDGDQYNFSDNDVVVRFGDVSNRHFIGAFFNEISGRNIAPQFVFHFAACATIQQAIAQQSQTWAVNYGGTRNMLAALGHYANRHPGVVQGFFHASTDKVYGEGSFTSYSETDSLTPLAYPYDESKAMADRYVRAAATWLTFPVVLYRFCNVYGPADVHKSRIVPGTLYRLLYTQNPPLLRKYLDDKGRPRAFCRDMIYVKDLVDAIMCLPENLTRKNGSYLTGQAFNLGTGHCYSMETVISRISSAVGTTIAPHQEIVPSGEIKIQSMNYDKLNSYFGFVPSYTLARGIQETVRWYLNHKEGMNDRFK